MQDAVGVDVEGHLDLRHAARCRRNAVEVELAELLVVAAETGARPAARGSPRPAGCRWRLKRSLTCGSESSCCARSALWRRRRRFDGERQRGHVEQEHVLHVALEHAALDGRADGDDFVRIHALVRLLADERARRLDHLGHARHAADEHQLVDRVRVPFRVLQAVLDRLDGALEEVVA